MNKKICLGLFLGMFLIVCSYSVIAAAASTTMGAPVAKGNYTTTLIFNCTTSVNTTGVRDYNVSFYVNASGGIINESVGRILTISNSSTTQSEFNDTSVDISALNSSRSYNVSCYADNGTTQKWSTAVSQIRIDNIAPNNISGFTVGTKTHYYNYSDLVAPELIYMNITVFDDLDWAYNLTNNYTPILSPVYFLLTNAAGNQTGSKYYAANQSAINKSTWWSATLNTTAFVEGTYNITAYARDLVGNINSSEIVYSITFDHSAPSVIFTCTPASVNVGSTVTCTCTGTDSTTMSAAGGGFLASPGTSSIGISTQTCTISDLMGYTGTATTTFTVTSGSSSSSSGGTSATTWAKTMVVTSEQFTEGYNQQVAAKERFKINVAGGIHHVGVKSLTTTSATIEVASDPVSVTLDIGEDAKVDVNADGTYDLYVKLNNIVSGKADVTVKELSEAVPAGQGAVSTSGELVTDDGEDKDQEGGSNTWIYIIVGIVILVVVGIGFGMKKK